MTANRYSVKVPIEWELVSERMTADGTHISEFEAPTALKGYRYHLTKTVHPKGEQMHYSVI